MGIGYFWLIGDRIKASRLEPLAPTDGAPMFASQRGFSLRKNSHKLSYLYLPSRETVARRAGLVSRPGDFPCYDARVLWATFNDKGSYDTVIDGYERFREDLIESMHAWRFFLSRQDTDDMAVADAWHVFLLSWSRQQPDGSRIMSSGHLEDLRVQLEQRRKEWFKFSPVGLVVKIHVACEDEAFACAVGPPGTCSLCYATNPVMPQQERRGLATRNPSAKLRVLIDEYDRRLPRPSSIRSTSGRDCSDNPPRSRPFVSHSSSIGRDDGAQRSHYGPAPSAVDRPSNDTQGRNSDQAALASVSAMAIQILALQQALDASVVQQRRLQELVESMRASFEADRN